MTLPEWRRLQLDEGILPEPGPETNRLVLWLPGKPAGAFRPWERVSTVPGAAVRTEQGLRTVAAISVALRQRLRGFLGRLWQRLRKPDAEATWILPDGSSAEQSGDRQVDLLLVWAEDDATPLDEERLRAHWRQATHLRRLGANLYLIAGIAPEAAAPEPPPGDPLEQAEQVLTRTRQAGDRRAEAVALTDLGIVSLRSGASKRAVAVLEQALQITRQAQDRAREADVLCQLALASLAIGEPQRGLEQLREALTSAHAAGDPLAEKVALDHLGILHTALRDYGAARTAYEQALAVARAVGDRQHQADLLWSLAIENAALGDSQQASAQAQAAIELFAQLGSPHVGWLTEHLQRYRAGETNNRLVSARPGYGGSSVIHAGPAQPVLAPANVNGLSVLHMAISAVKSMAWFLAAGAKVVGEATYHRRLGACAPCPHHTGLRCKVCGCFTSIKARLPHEKCPLGKWPE